MNLDQHYIQQKLYTNLLKEFVTENKEYPFDFLQHAEYRPFRSDDCSISIRVENRENKYFDFEIRIIKENDDIVYELVMQNRYFDSEKIQKVFEEDEIFNASKTDFVIIRGTSHDNVYWNEYRLCYIFQRIRNSLSDDYSEFIKSLKYINYCKDDNGEPKLSVIVKDPNTGKSQRCCCGANVFCKPDKTNENLFMCNSCERKYEGEIE